MKLFISVLLLFYASSAGAQTAAFISIEVYARKNKIDMVWYLEDIKMALPYYNNAKDITAVIADRVNKMFP